MCQKHVLRWLGDLCSQRAPQVCHRPHWDKSARRETSLLGPATGGGNRSPTLLWLLSWWWWSGSGWLLRSRHKRPRLALNCAPKSMINLWRPTITAGLIMQRLVAVCSADCSAWWAGRGPTPRTEESHRHLLIKCCLWRRMTCNPVWGSSF